MKCSFTLSIILMQLHIKIIDKISICNANKFVVERIISLSQFQRAYSYLNVYYVI